MKRLTTPMTRKDGATLLACVICGLFIEGGVLLVAWSDSQPHRATNFNYTTGAFEDRVVPAYRSQVTVQTNGDVQKIMQAVRLADPDSQVLPSAINRGLDHFDYGANFVGGFIGVFMFVILFRIVEKICGRVLGVKSGEIEK